MGIICRLATPEDHEALSLLFAEMQAHYGVPCPPADAIRAGLAARPAGVEIMLAERGGALAGFAAFAAIYPGPGLKPGLFMKELYVAAAMRSGGSGRALMKALAREALARGLGRIDWTADRDDARLCDFYAALGGRAMPEKLFFRLTGDALDELASGRAG